MSNPRKTCLLCLLPPHSKWATYCPDHRAVGEQKKRDATSRRLRRQWQEWKAKGINPTNEGPGAERRKIAIARSNHEQPRRKPRKS